MNPIIREIRDKDRDAKRPRGSVRVGNDRPDRGAKDRLALKDKDSPDPKDSTDVRRRIRGVNGRKIITAHNRAVRNVGRSQGMTGNRRSQNKNAASPVSFNAIRNSRF